MLTSSVGDAVVGVHYTQLLAAKDGVKPLRWSLGTGGTSLSWLRIDATTGALSGTPTTAAPQGASFTVHVSDATARSASASLSMRVAACAENDVSDCYLEGAEACGTGKSTCVGGNLGPCQPDGELSSTRTACGPECQACGANADRCEGGQCLCGGDAACPESNPSCCPAAGGGARCTNTLTDASACGPDCAACPEHPNVEWKCTDGTCSTDCKPGFARCPIGTTTPGCMTNTDTSREHCGGCGQPCAETVLNGTQACVSGTCELSCTAGSKSCDTSSKNGCETDVTTTSNCGECGATCTDAPTGGKAVCLKKPDGTWGVCGKECPAGTRLCGNTCVSLTDVMHCGACDSPCPGSAANASAVTCDGSRCRPTCNAGWGDCNGDVANGCEVNTNITAAHCGGCGQTCGETCSGGRCCADCGDSLCCAPGVCRRHLDQDICVGG